MGEQEYIFLVNNIHDQISRIESTTDLQKEMIKQKEEELNNLYAALEYLKKGVK